MAGQEELDAATAAMQEWRSRSDAIYQRRVKALTAAGWTGCFTDRRAVRDAFTHLVLNGTPWMTQ